jgi:hypothetical protein
MLPLRLIGTSAGSMLPLGRILILETGCGKLDKPKLTIGEVERSKNKKTSDTTFFIFVQPYFHCFALI